MTYFAVLFYFVILPTLALAALNIAHSQKHKPIPAQFGLVRPYWMLGILVCVAVLYTTPWDNYLVATAVWWYDAALVTGIVIGWVPLEEYLFFIFQTLMTGLWVLLLMRYITPDHAFTPRTSLRKITVTAVALLWLGACLVLVTGWDEGTYLGLELAWALPPIMLQLAVGADILWYHRKLVFSAILSATVYLCLVDAVGIGGGTWTINPDLTTGIFISLLPIEEALFFLITNILLVFGLVLGLSSLTQARLPESVQALLRLSPLPD